jgi:uncharacterized protein involved in exopolysaccharide biosynthesis
LSQVIKKQDISLTELINVLLAGKVKIIIGTLLFSVISVAIALYLPNQYKSKSTLIINTESNGGLAALAGNLSGLAGMAGINLSGSQSNSNPVIARELIKSQAFILRFIDQHNILVPLMAATQWREDSDTLVIDESIYDVNNALWLYKDTPSKADRPKQEDIVKRFKEVINLSEDSKTGVLTLSAEFYSPALAQQWLSLLINDINATVRQSDIEESSKNIDYLKTLIVETDNSYFKETFYKLIEEQTKTLMLSKVREDYVFKIIDPPNLPEKKSKPLRAVICILGTFFGGLLMSIWVLIGHYSRHHRAISKTDK